MSKRLWGLSFVLALSIGFFVAAPNVAQANSCSHTGTQTVPVTDANGNPVLDENGNPETTTQTITIDDPCITNFSVTATGYDTNDTTPYAQSPAKYVISFQVKNTTLNSGTKINVEFPSSFDLSAETDPSNLTSNVGSVSYLPATTIQVTVNSPVTSGSTVNITVENVINGPVGSYTISASSGSLSDSGSVSFGEAPNQVSSGSANCDHWYTCLFNFFSDMGNVIVSWLLAPIIFLLNAAVTFVGSLVLTLVKTIVGWILTATTGSFAGSAAETGFKTTLSIANVGFVIGIIVIAFATILRRTSYGLQKSLPRLILIAVFINFSFFIASAVIQVSNTITLVFFHNITVSFAPISLSQLTTNNGGNALANAIGTLVVPFFTLGFDLLAAFGMMALAIMFVIRYVAFTILLTLLPFVLVLWIFPNINVGGTGNAWGKWFEEFTKWIVFGPVAMLFVYVAFAVNISFSGNGGDTLVTMLVKLGILIGGLMVANSLSVKGAGFANKMAGVATRSGAGYLGAKTTGGLGMGLRKLGGVPEPEGAHGAHGTGGAGAATVSTQAPPRGVPSAAGVGGAAVGTAPAPRRINPYTGEEELPPLSAPTPPTPAPAPQPQPASVSTPAAPTPTPPVAPRTGRIRTAIGGLGTGLGTVSGGIKHWGEGGPSMKDVLKEGGKELLKTFGNPEHSVFEGLLGHTKTEEAAKKYAKKLKKAQDLHDWYEENEVTGNAGGLSHDDQEKFNLLKRAGGLDRLKEVVKTAQQNLIEGKYDLGKLPTGNQSQGGGGHPPSGGGGSPPPAPHHP